MSELYVGTEKGLQVLSEDGGRWRVVRTILEDCEISAVVRRADGALLVATRQSGLFRVAPASGAVAPIGSGVLPKGLRCIAVSPQDPDCLFVGCEPTAIYRSADGGGTWNECRGVAELARQRDWKYPVPFIPPHIRHILVDRADPRRIYASGQIGGVLRSEDGGETWHDVVKDLDPDVHTLAQDPENAQVLYASTGGGGFVGGPTPPPEPQGYPLYRSGDAGRTWRSMSSAFTRRHSVPLHIYPKEPSTLVAAAASDNPGVWRKRPEGADAVIMVSRDSGDTWTQLRGEGLPATFPTMVEAIETDHAGTGRVYLGVGGEGTKMLPPGERKGAVFYADRLEGPWHKVPAELPVVFTLTPG
jgi:photosystem II stability/assembly factor-like uncharacterized protein